MPSTATAPSKTASLNEADALEVMWVYYRDHKAQLISDIKEYRAGIVAQLMAGVGPEQVFAPYFKPPAAKPGRRAA